MKNKFRAVEVGIFSIVSLIFLNSVYNLFTDGRLLGSGERKPLAVKLDHSQSESERAATGVIVKSGSGSAEAGGETITGFVPYETKCAPSGEVFETSAAKVRILGPFCGASGRQLAGENGARADSLSDYKIENTTSHYVATVFSDQGSGKFSTDFIPLEPGANKIIMEFRYKSGKVFPVELSIVRK